MGATLGDAAERVELLLACSQEVIVTADVAEAQQSSHMVLEDGTSLLPQFSVMPLSSSCNDQISRLRLFFAGASEEEAAQCAVVASTTICQRLPVGHSWGEEILQFGAEDGAAADYGIVRTSLREKCISHMKLIWVLLSTRAWDFFPSIRRDISRHHSFLKSCLGMCLSLTESQSKKQKQVGVSGGIAWFLSTGHEHMLEAVVDGMVAAVNLMPEMDEFTALGLRTVDSFFSQTLQLPRGLYCIAKALSAKGTELHRCDSLVPSAYAMLSICLSVLQAGDSKVLAPKQRADVISSHSPSSEYLSSEFPSSVSFSNDVRAAVGCTLQCMRTGLSLQLAEGPLSARSKYLQKAGWRREVEGHRVISLCTALLQSFSVELGLFAETQLTSEQKRRLDIAYNEAKDVCIDVLFLLGHAADAFDLASKFTHFRGLLEANEQDKSLNPSLYCTVKDYGKSVDPTDGCTPLGLFALHFFKERNQVSMIIEYSKVIDKVQLCTFFADHPQLAWICSILRNSGDAGFDMQESARASLLHSQACTDLATAKTLISISKLCSVVSMSSYQNNDESTEESVYQCAVSNLAVIRAQEVVKDARRLAFACSMLLIIVTNKFFCFVNVVVMWGMHVWEQRIYVIHLWIIFGNCCQLRKIKVTRTCAIL